MIFKIVVNSSNREKEKLNDNSRFIVGKAVREPHITSGGIADSSGLCEGVCEVRLLYDDGQRRGITALRRPEAVSLPDHCQVMIWQ